MSLLQKYPKTFHLPWSPGLLNDDRRMPLVPFEGQEVVITEKMDGENTTMYRNHIHARSLDSANHPSRNWVKAFWGTFRYEMSEDLRICGENVYALHSIAYNNLRSYFLGFSAWEGDICLDWDSTILWFALLGIPSVPIMYRGKYNESVLRQFERELDFEKQEGYVVRLASSFHINDFQTCVGKYVRQGHVQTDEFWMSKPVVPNKLLEE